MRRNVILNSPRLKEIRRKKHKIARKKYIYICSFFVFLFIALALISRIPAFNIKNINVTGNKITESKIIEKIIQDEIKGNYLWFIPKTNFLVYPHNKIEKKLKNELKRIKDLSIKNKNIKNLEIIISEYEEAYLYCGLLVPVLQNNIENYKCYFLDESGYIFDEAPYFSGNVYFKFYGDSKIKKDNPIGFYFLKEKFLKLTQLKRNIEKMGLGPVAFWLDENKNIGNFSLIGETTESPYITFKIDSDYQKLAENLQAAISVEPLKSDLKTKISSLLYIDLRFGNKVYYKFK